MKSHQCIHTGQCIRTGKQNKEVNEDPDRNRLLASLDNTAYCKFRNFREGFVFAKLRICDVS